MLLKHHHPKENTSNTKKDTIVSCIVMVLIAVLFVTILSMRVSGQQIKLFGFSFYKIATDSMEPELMVGDVILIKEVDVAKLKVGDVITYMGTTGAVAGLPVTHKMIAEPKLQSDGSYLLYTCGVKEGATMDTPFSDTRLMGKFITKLRVLTWVYSFFETPLGLILILLPIIALIAFEVINIVKQSNVTLEEKEDANDKKTDE